MVVSLNQPANCSTKISSHSSLQYVSDLLRCVAFWDQVDRQLQDAIDGDQRGHKTIV